ncbi:MAG: hypothetical protein RLZZ344_286 [Pseudomonadota bacterium]
MRQVVDRLAGLGLQLTEEEANRLLYFVRILSHWNKIHNLTAVRTPEAALETHLVDPLLAAPYLMAKVGDLNGRALDVGSGAGIPAIPWALVLPALRIDLVEKVGKKQAFLRHAISRLGLSARVRVHAMEVEALQGGETYAMIVSRAFASLSRFVGLTLHLSRVGTQWVYMAGRLSPIEGLDLNNSMYTHPALGPSIVLDHIDTLSEPGPDSAHKERHLVWLRRVA